MWLVLGLAGLVTVVSGWLPPDVAWEVGAVRAGPVLAFLVAITMLAELASRAGVFRAAAIVCARAGRGSTRRLFLLIAVLATVITVGMSLDTTAVLLTPVILAMTEVLGVAPLPFALLVVWLANTASLLLPVSNLTNLLALQHEAISTFSFASRMALPELAAVAVTTGYLFVLFRRKLRGSYVIPDHTAPQDPIVFWVCAVSCLTLAPGVVLGVAPWVVATAAAAASSSVYAWRRPGELRVALVPWRVVVLTEGLFITVAAMARHGLTHLLGALAGDSLPATVAVSAASANLLNNLPTYLAIEPSVPPEHTTRLFAVLLGTNAGPLILLWGSLATILWRDRCRAGGLRIHPVRFALVGVAGVPLILAATAATLLR